MQVDPKKLKELILQVKKLKKDQTKVNRLSDDIAIVGIGCRFAGESTDYQKLWENLIKEKNLMEEVPGLRWDLLKYYDSELGMSLKSYVKKGFFIKGFEQFDPDFFGIPTEVAFKMDPQQRMAMTVTWEALEDAGIQPSSLKGTDTGVFLGMMANDHSVVMTQKKIFDHHMATGNANSIASGRISHFLGTHGPSVTIDTACSSSLVAAHYACQSLKLGESKMAIVGGVNLQLSPYVNASECSGKTISIKGQMTPYSEDADGYIRGDGCGVLVLKLAKDAVRDGDRIHALIKGSAINHDGHSSGLTVPNGKAQVSVLKKAVKNSGLKPKEIDYIEGHGTGTSLGDPIEVQSIDEVYGSDKDNAKQLLIGSGKSNFGHCEAAAGILGLIKAAMICKEKKIPKSLYSEKPTRKFDWDSSNLSIVSKKVNLDKASVNVGVSSFGLSGTNAHFIVSTNNIAPIENREMEGKFPNIPLFISANDSESLIESIRCYQQLFRKLKTEQNNSLIRLASLIARDHYKYRVVLDDTSEKAFDEKITEWRLKSSNPPRLAKNVKTIFDLGEFSTLYLSQLKSYVVGNSYLSTVYRELEQFFQDANLIPVDIEHFTFIKYQLSIIVALVHLGLVLDAFQDHRFVKILNAYKFKNPNQLTITDFEKNKVSSKLAIHNDVSVFGFQTVLSKSMDFGKLVKAIYESGMTIGKSVLKSQVTSVIDSIPYTQLKSKSIWTGPYQESRDRDNQKSPKSEKLAVFGSENNHSISPRESFVDRLGNVLSKSYEELIELPSLLALGLDSLLILKLQEEVLETTDFKLPLELLMGDTTVAEILEYIDASDSDKNSKNSQNMGTRRNNQLTHYEISIAQKPLWSAFKVSKRSSAFNVTFSLVSERGFEFDKIYKTLKCLAKKHPILQTIYEEEGNTVHQKITDNPIIFPRRPSSVWNLQEAIEKAGKTNLCLDKRESYKLFWHKSVHELSESITFVFHHISMDMISTDILLSDFKETYSKIDDIDTTSLKASNISYLDYCKYQNDLVDTYEYRQSKKFWEQHLESLPAPLVFPFSKKRPTTQSFTSEFVTRVVPSDVKDKINTFTKEQKISKYCFYLGVYILLLAKSSDRKDLIIGTPTNGREEKKFRSLVGYMVNVIPMCFEVNSDDIGTYFKEVANRIVENLSHRKVTFQDITSSSKYIPDPSFPALFNLMFNWNNSHTIEENQDSPEFKSLAIAPGGCSHDMILSVLHTKNLDKIFWNFNSDLFDKKDMETFCDRFLSVINQILEGNISNISDIHFSTEKEQFEVFHQWNQNVRDYGPKVDLYNLIKEPLNRNDSSIAVEDADGSTSYKALREKVDRLCDRIMAQNLPAKSNILICLRRNVNAIAAMISAVKLGLPFIPVSPETPISRINTIAKKSNSSLAIVEGDFDEAIANTKSISIDSNFWKGETPKIQIECDVKKNDLAYIIFTSGSTGEPKGVAIEHGAVVNTIHSINEMLDVTKDSTVLCVSNFNFDLAIYDIFGMLAEGSKIVLVPEKDQRNPEAWHELTNKHEVTVWNSVPALYNIYVEYLILGNVTLQKPSLKSVMLSGDWVPLNLPKKSKDVFGESLDLFSLGGATEASIWSIYYPIKEVCDKWRSIPYGYPLPNQKMFVLDENLNACPKGYLGDIYIGGIGLAREYLGSPDLTEKAFIIHPILKERIYRTGDTGRYIGDGLIEFCGRKDRQVKLNGFRIELGEIEQVTLKDKTVNTATAVIEKDTGSLVLFVTGSDAMDPQEVKKLCSQKLPTYMVPKKVIHLERIPLGKTGKVDYKKLFDEREAASPEPTKQKVVEVPKEVLESKKPSQTEFSTIFDLEKKIVSCWEKALDKQDICLKSNFFVQGGDSLKIVNLHSILKNELKRDFPMAVVFENPTVRGLCEYFEAQFEITKIEESTGDTRQSNRLAMLKKRKERKS